MKHAGQGFVAQGPDAGAAPGSSPMKPGPGIRNAMLVGVLALAAVLRFALLGRNSVWFDEAYVVKVALARWQAIPGLLRAAEFHPPASYAILKVWISAAGLSDAAIRVPSAVFSTLAVGLTYAVVRRASSEPVSLLSALLVGVSPFAVMAGQDAKMYALLGALTLGSMLSLSAGVRRGGVVRWGAYALITALMLYTHYLAFLVVLAQAAWVAWFERASFRGWLAAVAVVALLYAPWAPSLWTQVHRVPADGWHDPPSLQDLGQLLGLYAFGGSLFGMPGVFFSNTSLAGAAQAALLLPFAAVAWCGAVALARDDGRRAGYVLLPLLVPVGVAFALSLARPAFEARWFSFLAPFYTALVARGIIDVGGHTRRYQRLVTTGLAGALLLASVPVFGGYYFDPRFRPYQWRLAAAVVRDRARPGDLFAYGDYQSELAFTYYFGATPAEVVLGTGHDAAVIRTLEPQHPRMWLIVAPPFTGGMLAQTLASLRGGYTTVGRSGFNGGGVFPVVYLLQARATPAGSVPPIRRAPPEGPGPGRASAHR